MSTAVKTFELPPCPAGNIKNKSIRRRIAKWKATQRRYEGVDVKMAGPDFSQLNHFGNRIIKTKKKRAAMGRCRHDWKNGGVLTKEKKELFYCPWCGAEKLKNLKKTNEQVS